jgi:hypothetical protein
MVLLLLAVLDLLRDYYYSYCITIFLTATLWLQTLSQRVIMCDQCTLDAARVALLLWQMCL